MNTLAGFMKKFWISLVISSMIFQTTAPTLAGLEKPPVQVNAPQVQPANFSATGMTLGSAEPPTEKVPDFAAQVAAQAQAQPPAPQPLGLKAFATPAIY